MKSKKIEFICADICKKQTLKKIIEKGDHVFHLAALGGSRQMPFKIYEKINVIGTKNILDVSIENKASKFFFMSTISVMSGSRPIPFDETTKPIPKSIYGITKYRAEKYIKKKSKKNITSIIFRAPLIYGPSPHKDSGIFNIVNMLNKSFYPMVNKGRTKIAMINVHNLIEMIKITLKITNKKTHVFFVKDNETLTMHELVSMLQKITKIKNKIIYIPSFFLTIGFSIINIYSKIFKKNTKLNYDVWKGAVSNQFTYSITKVKKLGYKQKNNLKQGFNEVLRSLNMI
ncbi:NAD(P)-dependent oxidoreductase [Candidatus Woesearchaeota archaeon]|nr:NAD(P)-dependent oxidoreductase [archaeon]MBT5023485.1 NAD(P)-dependent oxidoreductase [Candidatus Woesearchaeota archaeon]MBT4022596.1 NAD(P)-dependent oxidoreductase [archaeon]MBT4272036.1 NAD(P)-dependent oxidoreductase [archaeon]MBT4461133.1 NAD(P)-dependent oxidoreductase [archaeon]